MFGIIDECVNRENYGKGGRSSVVEFQPSKLAVVGSNPIARSKKNVLGQLRVNWRVFGSGNQLVERGLGSRMTSGVSSAHVAQLVEHVLGKDEVTRSIRVVGSIQGLLDPGCE